MKKFLALLLSLSMVLALSACGGTKSDDTTKADETKTDAPAETATDFKVGFIMLHDENSTYDLNFINAAKEAGMGGLVFTGDINEVKKAIGF